VTLMSGLVLGLAVASSTREGASLTSLNTLRSHMNPLRVRRVLGVLAVLSRRMFR